jgi:putative ABC transport system permease protein
VRDVLLDFRLALRMLARYPLLTIVSTLGMAFGLAVGVVGFEVRSQLVNPRLPLDDGERIVGLRNWDAAGDRAVRLGDADFRAWQAQLTRIEDLGAAALVDRNLAIDGDIEPVRVAEMTASGFRLARVRPVLGRLIVASDESPGSASVAVIGHSLWQRRFLGNPRAVGQLVRLGNEQTTIVGVMPDGFGFPSAHEVWVPLRPQAPGNRTAAPALLVFGRLADGVTREEAQAELTVMGQRRAAADPATYRFVRAEIVPFAHLVFDPRGSSLGLTLANVFLLTLMLVICANVALLMFARASSREQEIGVRTALGASRGRIVAQLFVEALALSGLSVVAGLAVARYAVRSFWRMLEADSGRVLPFWFTDALTPSTIAYGAGLTLLAAIIIGVLPALKVTGRSLEARLRSFASGAGGGYRFGGVWTAVIATQVAVTLMFPAAAFFFHGWVVEGQTRDVGVAAERYLTARLELDAPNGGRSVAATLEELRRQLAHEPGVGPVTFVDTLPGMQHASTRFEVEGDDAPATYGYTVGTAAVDEAFFDAMGAPVSGRPFMPADLATGREVAVVNASFVERVMRGRPAVGRRVRRVARQGEPSNGAWIEIVGVDLGVASDGVGLYRPLAIGSSPVHIALRTSGPPAALANRLRTLAGRVEPALRVYDVRPLSQAGAVAVESQYFSRLLALLSGLTLLLSLIAIYSVTAFTVRQRMREIGTRVALGADSRRVVTAVVRRPLGQIGLGIAAGAGLVVFLFVGMFQAAPTALEAGIIAAYAAVMLMVCLSACVVPVRWALRLQPSQVLRPES